MTAEKLLAETPTLRTAHEAIPVWNAENWFYEDWPVGEKIRSLRRTIAESDSHMFNLLVTDIHPYVQDQIFAENTGIFGRRLVAGAFVFSAGLGLVATNCVNAFSYGYDKLRFIKPVFLGDTIYTIRTNLDRKPRYKDLASSVPAMKCLKVRASWCFIVSICRQLNIAIRLILSERQRSNAYDHRE